MCDYSIHNAKTRPAAVGDKLETYQFGYTTGFTPEGDGSVAVCLRAGTEIAFDEPIAIIGHYGAHQDFEVFVASHIPFKQTEHRVGRFRQIDMESVNRHHDALELPDGQVVLLTNLQPGQRATVLQLPAEAKAESLITPVEKVIQRVRNEGQAVLNRNLVKID